MRRVLIAVATVVVLSLAGAATAAADVLVNYVPRHVQRCFRVGVWYQAYSGGSRRVVVDVHRRHGRVLLHRRLKARSGGWRYWRLCPARGHYVVTYRVPGHTVRYRVTVRR